MMYEYIFVYIVLPLIIIIKIIVFFVGNIFSYFFHVHLNILDKVVSGLYANFGTPVYCNSTSAKLGATFPGTKFFGTIIFCGNVS
jgi:hypothetical protein